ncbi:MAG: isocitrate lyase/phosphoenolpyruvate mutase family protein [Acetobacterales bacterium]
MAKAHPARRLRALVKRRTFIYMPSLIDGLGARLAKQLGFKAIYTGGYATGGSTTITEPLLTMSEQVDQARRIARVTDLPMVCDAGAGFGEPMHTMRTVDEFHNAGIAGIHIEDQLYPKRAHYHKYVAHAVPQNEFVDKIRWACRARDKIDPDFVIIARSDTCRFLGLGEAIKRINAAADVGAAVGLIFPRDHKETVAAPKKSKIPLVWVQSRGNRDGRPLYSNQQLEEMGYIGCIDAQVHIGVAFHFFQQALKEIRKTGDYSGMSQEDWVAARQAIEDLCGLDEYYEVEEQTVEKKSWGKR